MKRGKEPKEMGGSGSDKVRSYFYSQTKIYTKYDQTGLNNHRIKIKSHLGIQKKKLTSTCGVEKAGHPHQMFLSGAFMGLQPAV